jgi:hypothetical protein
MAEMTITPSLAHYYLYCIEKRGLSTIKKYKNLMSRA